MNEHLLEEAATVFNRAAATAEGLRVLRGHDEDYQFNVQDGPSFHVSIQEGRLRVVAGDTPRKGYFESTYIDTDSQTLRELFSGKLRPVEAIEQRRFKMLIRMYEGCQITILLRIGGELCREAFLHQAAAGQILAAGNKE